MTKSGKPLWFRCSHYQLLRGGTLPVGAGAHQKGNRSSDAGACLCTVAALCEMMLAMEINASW